MPNTVSGPFAAINVVNGSTAANATWGNNAQTQAGVALASFNPDLVTGGFVLSGAVATRHNSYYAAVQTDTPLRYYRLGDSVTSLAVDSSANALHGIDSGVPTVGVAGALTGDGDTAMTFAAASSQRITLPDNGLPAANTTWSVELWFKIASLPGGTQVLAGWGTAATKQTVSIIMTTTGISTSVFGSATAARSPSLNTWHHFVATWDGTTLKDYLDGVVGTGITPGALSVTLTGTAAIGVRTDLTLYFSGSLDEVAFYSGALSSTRVTAHYTAGTTATTQVDIASGVAYLIQSDGTLARCVIAATNETTSTHSTTYFLDLNPDGSWSWATSHSGVANHITICSVLTDGSGNAITVTDARVMSAPLLTAATAVSIPGAPTMLAQALDVPVLTNNDQVIVLALTPARGTYRFSLYFNYRNSTPGKVTAYARWSDGGFATSNFMLTNTGAAGQFLTGSQANNTGNNQVCTCAVIDARVDAATLLAVHFQDAGTGTVNDVVSVTVSRIA